MFQGLGSDLRYVLRVLRRSPGFTFVAVLSLALGIGANTAMFGVVRALLLTPLPVAQPQELSLVTWRREGDVSINQMGTTDYRDPDTGVRYRSSFSTPLVQALRTATPRGVSLFAFAFLRGVSVGVGDQPALAAGGVLADGDYFSTLGVEMALGRPLGRADDTPGAPLAVVLSHAFWMRAFGGDPGAVGRTVRVNGTPAEVVGVTADGFTGLSMGGFFPQTEITVPLSAQARVYPRLASGRDLATDPGTFWLRVMARIPATGSVASTERVLGAAFRAQPSPLSAGDGHVPELHLLPGAHGAQPVREQTARLLYVLLGVVAMVLLIACVNLASLMLARGVSRQRDVAVRRALGGGRIRLIRQVLLEALTLAATGTVAGLVLATVSRRFLRSLLTGSLGAGTFGNLDMQVSLDPVVLALSAGLGTVATLVFGLLPAVRLSGVDPMAWLKHRAAGSSGTPRLSTGRALIALQIAVSVPLVVGAALFLRTAANIGGVDLGFDPRGVVTFQVDPGYTHLPEEEYPRLYQELLSRVQAIPGVRSATLMENALMSGITSNGMVTVDGERHMLFRDAVGPGFVETLGIPLLAGRVPGLQDGPDDPRVGAVNQAAVREIFGGASPVGRILHTGGRDVRIVGVVGDLPYRSRREPVPPTLYDAALQHNGYGGHHVVLRTDVPLGRLEPAIRAAVSQVDRDLPVPEIQSQTALMAQSSARERVFTQLLTIFGAFVLLLASIGLHGVTSYAVTRRTSEIGVRMAVGARPTQILWLVLRQVVVLAGAGLVVGIPVALALSPLVGSLLYGVEPADPASVVAAALIMAGVAAVAGLLPARRAARLDALRALRSE